MYGGVGKAIEAMYWTCVVMFMIFVPLGTWKLVEIIYWLCTHVTIGVR